MNGLLDEKAHPDRDGGLSVIKVGGSLLDWPELPARLRDFLDHYREQEQVLGARTLLMAGGGPAADVVRALDRTFDLGDLRAHRLAICALDWTAELLAKILPGALVVCRPEAFRSAWNSRRIPVLAPRRILEDFDDPSLDALPASWDVTSDSISARVGVILGASRLILLKSRGLPRGATVEQAVGIGLVDPYFGIAARGVPLVATVCLRDPEASLQAMAFDRRDPGNPCHSD
jgi:aspartokinase-like uncharacterized kinase